MKFPSHIVACAVFATALGLGCLAEDDGGAVVGAPAAPAAPIADASARATGAEIVASERQHPRLMVEGSFDRLRELHRSNKFPASFAVLRSSAEALVATDASGALVQPLLRSSDGSLLTLARELMDWVYSLVLTNEVTPDPRYVDRAWRELANVCNPAFFPRWRDGTDDLSLAEFAHAVSVGYDWLYSDLSAARRRHLRANLVERVLVPAQAMYQARRWWDVPTKLSNWNLVVNGGMIAAALAVGNDGDEGELVHSAAVLDLALASLRRGLAYFDAQGGTGEGPGYWIYAMEYLNLSVESLITATGSHHGLLDSAGVQNTPEFIMQIRSNRGRAFNFADSQGIGTTPAMHWLGWRVARPLYRWYARTPYNGRRQSAAYFLLNFHDEGDGTTLAALPRIKRFAGVEVAAMRGSWTSTNTPWLAFKGGDNQNSHAHLDLGSFVFEVGGVDWFVDPGLDSYSLPGYFANRGSDASPAYDYYRIRSEGQNTFIINPGEGPEQSILAKAPITVFNADRQVGVVDLGAAYARHTTAARRGFALLPAGAVIRDELDGARAPLTYLWMAHVRSTTVVRVLDGGTAVVLVAPNGERLLVAARGPGLRFRTGQDGSALLPAVPLPTSPNPPGQTPNTNFRKLVIEGSTATSLRVSVLLHRLAPGDAEAVPLQLDPRVDADLSAW